MTIDSSLPASFVEKLIGELHGPGSAAAEVVRPVHVVYGGAHLFTERTVDKLGERARVAMDTWGMDAVSFGRAIGITEPALAEGVASRVRAKLAARPVEALCIDFEDGYGPRSDEEEDAEATRSGAELARTSASGTTIGIRIKALGGPAARRGIRTLDRFVTSYAKANRGRLRDGFSVTLPKISAPDEVRALVDVLERLESLLGIERAIDVELMVETPSALIRTGGLAVPALVEAARGRAVAVHLGAYDFTAELGVTAGDQRLDHPYCDLARMLLKLGAAGTRVGVSDGATTILPIAPKSATAEESAVAVHRAWALHAANVRRAIDVGIWQGWDLHPAQLPARYGALFGYFLSRRGEMTKRLRSFVENATQASRVGQIFDDAATGQGLMTFFVRGLRCGALDEADLRDTSLSVSELSRSFTEIVAMRAEGAQA
ncbi:MAG TPA: phosphoenolpyruvate kinase [Labilithrix sp.]|nr:phosphoenolpyruvate kinase [Labilithrix sp.]